MSLRTPHLASILLASILLAPIGRADNWPGWRGPTGYGYTSEKSLPLSWDGKSGKNVLWKASLKGTTGHSTPVVWGDRVFVTTAVKQTRDEEARKEIPDHHVLCFRVSDGKQLWKTRIVPGDEVAGYAIYASPTPATDGKAVYVWFGSGVVAAVDFDGKLLWRHKKPGPFSLNPGITSSPVLYKDTVILICDQGRQKGFLQGLDRKTGEVKWEQKRKDTSYCNATPLLLEVKGKTQLIVSASNALQGLDPADGKLIWWCKGRGFGSSPAVGGGLVYQDRGGNEPAQAVDPTGTGDVTKTHVKWRLERLAGDYSSPVISGGRIYRVQAEGLLTCLKLSDGEEVFSKRLPGLSKLASPVATADGRIYLVSTRTSYVLEADDKGEVLAKNELGGSGGNNGSSPAISDGKIFVRDFDNLYCIGEEKKK
jgi:outer membrane protein assembly factor BamB